MAKREAVLRNLGGQQVDNNNNNNTEVQHCYVNVDSKKLPPSSSAEGGDLQLLKITVAGQVLVEVTLATEEKGKVSSSSRRGGGQQQQQQKVMRVKVKEL